MPLDPTERDETWTNVGLSMEEFEELIRLIDDEPVDEEFLLGIRKKLVAKRKRLRGRVRDRDEANPDVEAYNRV